MAAKIDIDAQKFKKKSRTNEAENQQKIKKSCLNSWFTGSKKDQCTLICSLLKNFETHCCC